MLLNSFIPLYKFFIKNNPPDHYVSIHNKNITLCNYVLCMQYKSHKTLQLNKEFGNVISELRVAKNKDKSKLKFCYE